MAAGWLPWLRLGGTVISALLVALLVGFLLPLPMGYWIKGEAWLPTYFGAVYTVAAGAATFILALVIFNKQNQLQKRVMDRIFGTMSGFDDVYDQVVRLVEDANKKEGSELATMVYWLWFGVDRRLEVDYDVSLDKIKPNDSRFRLLLEHRRLKGHNTTVVAYHPDAWTPLHQFVNEAFAWQIDKIPPPHSTAKRTITPTEIDSLLQRYKKDLEDFEKRRTETSKTRFNELCLKEVIPMLMFAGRDRQSNWFRGLIYLGETEALAKRAKTGGFMSEDPEIVDVIFSQILSMQPRATPGVPASTVSCEDQSPTPPPAVGVS